MLRTTYQNPVWAGYFADPFVLRWNNEYYAYGTGPAAENGRVFPILHSLDLAGWTSLGGALDPLRNPACDSYWAPEVAVHEGRFYLYYSAASGPGDDTHRLRVATADHPAGPFTDSGRILLPDEGFTIDAHPFRDPRDGKWYLFYARDFFDERVGTGTAVVTLADDMMTATCPPRTVIRASSDWQIYERNRTIYGQQWEAWHTVEGPFVLVHEGRYYCFYSGGAWHSENYGVSYAVADHPLGPYIDRGDEAGPLVLRGVPGVVVGPGHNSVTLGPDNHTEFMVYHAWDPERTARRMCIDPLVWTENGPYCKGPSRDVRPLVRPTAAR
ncbi:MAG: glycoside hydrolase family 43 protein [Chloroflexi bacterium]|nr:glycoside hydrolase family 43 protein [Chloroflexota bacterium]